MSEAIKFREMKLEAGWLMVKPVYEDMGKAMALVRKKKDKFYNCTIKEHQKKRSLDANAYAWVLINKLAEVMRLDPVEVYRQAIQEISGNNEVMPIKEEAVDQFKNAWARLDLQGHGQVKDSRLPKPDGLLRKFGVYGPADGCTHRKPGTGLQGS